MLHSQFLSIIDDRANKNTKPSPERKTINSPRSKKSIRKAIKLVDSPVPKFLICLLEFHTTMPMQDFPLNDCQGSVANILLYCGQPKDYYYSLNNRKTQSPALFLPKLLTPTRTSDVSPAAITASTEIQKRTSESASPENSG